MATYNKVGTQHGNDSWEDLPKYEVEYKSTSTSSTVDSVSSSLEKLKTRLSSTKAARDRRVSLFEACQQKLPTSSSNQTYPTVESYPPHRAQFARQQREQLEQQRHQSWYPHYQSSSTECVDAKPDASKVADMKKYKGHQSWYPRFKISSNINNNTGVVVDAEKVKELTKYTQHQSWYPHYKAEIEC